MFKTTNTDGFWGLGTGDSEGGRRGGVSHAQWVSLSHTLALPHSLYLSPCVCLAPKGEDRRQSATTAHSSQTNEREKHHTKPDMALQQVGSILPSLSPPPSLLLISKQKTITTFIQEMDRLLAPFFFFFFSSAYLCTTTCRHLHRTPGWVVGQFFL